MPGRAEGDVIETEPVFLRRGGDLVRGNGQPPRTERFDQVGQLYRDNLVLALGTAGFTPIPYKVFTIAGGAFVVPFAPFVLVSMVSRGMRFFLVAGLIYALGPRVKTFIDRYFNLLTIVFVVVLALGFYVIKFVAH